MNKLLNGKSDISRIVGLECVDSSVEIFIQQEDGSVVSEFRPHRYWILTHNKLAANAVKLEGDLHYKYGYQFATREDFEKTRSSIRNEDSYSIYNAEEACMVKDGYTFYRDLKPTDLAVLSFDIETTGLDGEADDAKVLLISTTYRDHNGKSVNRLFSYDDYKNEGELITSFCSYVRQVNPSVIIGHNIITYDFPYLKARAEANNVTLELGRNNSQVKFNHYESKFRLDGTRDLLYKNISIYGREICDTYFLSVSFDVSKSFETYALKPLIKQLGFEKQGRQYYDAGEIRKNYKISSEWLKIKQYAIDDAEDPIKLFDMMSPTYFYSCQNIPKPFSEVILSATGSKINSMLVRSYLQDKHSIPKSTDMTGLKLEGGISFGVPGLYKNALKIDLKSCYPSQILRFQIYDRDKDPYGHFYQIVKYFTEKRFEYKELAKKTKDSHYINLDNTSKIFINSAYGTLSTVGLNFNSPENAAKITKESRKIIDLALKWASGKGVDYWMEKYGNKEFESDI